jgi:hypothetical protein
MAAFVESYHVTLSTTLAGPPAEARLFRPERGALPFKECMGLLTVNANQRYGAASELDREGQAKSQFHRGSR